MMKNSGKKALSWAISLAVHALGAALILVAGFHLATPQGEVTDKVEFEAVGQTPQAPPQQAQPPAPVQQPAPQKQEEQSQTKPDTPKAVEPEQPVQQEEAEAPVVDEAPADEVAKEKPKETEEEKETKMAEAKEAADAAQDPAQEPVANATPSAEATPNTTDASGTPAPSPIAEVAGLGGVDKNPLGDSNASPLIDETKLTEISGNRRPDYPWTSRLRRQQGTVVLQAFIKSDGTVAFPSVAQSSGFPLLDQEALKAYSKWKYQPGPSGKVLKPFKFSLK